MMLKRLSTGDAVHRYQKSIVVQFTDKRKVLSTAYLNGGYSEDLEAVFNHDANPGAGMACTLRADTYRDHMGLIAKELGLNPEAVAGISTAASMDNVSIRSAAFEDVTVTAIVTGGVEVNGGRVGDPAAFHERQGQTVKVQEGTINIMLNIDADLPPEALTRALVTCTEAKTAALQELMAGSNYSRGLATGSGTDGTIVISNSQSETKLMFAGKHSKLGELIGRAVKPAVKEALYLQTGLSPQYQHSVLRRMKRFGMTEEVLWEHYITVTPTPMSKPEFIQEVEMLDGYKELVAVTSLYAHLLDQLDWGLLKADVVVAEAGHLIERMANRYQTEHCFTVNGGSCEELITALTENYTGLLINIIQEGNYV